MKKDIIRRLVQIIIVVIPGAITFCWPTKIEPFLYGFIGVILLDIYGILIEKGKL